MDKPDFNIPSDFKLKILATNWGLTASVDAFCEKAKAEGYDGIEMWWQGDKQKQDELFSALKKHQLDVGFYAVRTKVILRKTCSSFSIK